eukprot:13456010-Ditylum_brightwellii.AAC.1
MHWIAMMPREVEENFCKGVARLLVGRIDAPSWNSIQSTMEGNSLPKCSIKHKKEIGEIDITYHVCQVQCGELEETYGSGATNCNKLHKVRGMRDSDKVTGDSMSLTNKVC